MVNLLGHVQAFIVPVIFVRMKRTFPAIVILISLSLLGLILLQTSWLRNLLEVTESQLHHKMEDACVSVVKDLSKNNYNGKLLRLPRRGGLSFSSDFHLHLLKPPTVEEKFTPQEVYDKLRQAFNDNDLKGLKFEFAVTNTNDDYEMASKNFDTEFWDTTRNQRSYWPIIPENMDVEGQSTLEKLIIVVPDFKNQVWASIRWIIIVAIIFMITIIAAFFLTVKSLLNQKKLSEIKSDFINNMTHEFKTPLATISLAVDALRNEKVQADKEKTRYFSSIIKEENIRMNKHVETILQAALIEKQELQLNLHPLHTHKLIKSILGNYELQLEDKQGKIELRLNALNDVIFGDDVHFSSLISNLIDNAIKYSKVAPRVIITTHSTKKHFILKVEDNGIGMSKETVKRIFEKFYRAHTGNLHDVKGFGLGMSYVKTVIEAHKGKIKVESTLGKGSVFIVEVPLKLEK